MQMKRRAGSFSLMKRMNTALILNIIREKGTISRTQLASETGLTAATVTNITAELIDNGLVTEFTTGISTGGRKPILLRINSDAFFIASAYVSPDKVEVAVADFGANIIFYKHRSITDAVTPDECVDYIVNSLGKFENKENKKIIGLGVALHGIVNSGEGTVINAPNLNWKNVHFRELLEEKTNIPVLTDNDVRLMALAEMWFGTARYDESFVLLYISRGVGSAVVIGGKVLRGFTESAGEIGHCMIDPAGPVCECGKKGCLQALTNEKAMLENLKENLHLTDILNESSDCADIVDAYLNQNDKAATIVIENEIKHLKTGISTIINMINPELIVLNTDIKDFDIATTEELSKCAKEESLGATGNECTVKYSHLGKRSVLKGAIALVMSSVYDNPQSIWEK